MTTRKPKGGSIASFIKTKAAKKSLADTLTPQESSDISMPDAVKVGMSKQRIRLTLDQIEPFSKNPRVRTNDAYAEIKESIRQDGLHSELDVTQRPGEDIFVLDRGGNTRLKILNELWEETKEEKYWHQYVTLHPYVSELKILALHLSENNERGSMSFWDNCVAHMDLWEQLNEQEGTTLSGHKVIEILPQYGLSTQKTNLYAYQFIWENFRVLGIGASHFSARQARELQTPFNHLIRCCKGHSDAETLIKVINNTLKEYGQKVKQSTDLKASKIMNELYPPCAQIMGYTVDELLKVIQASNKYKNLDFEGWVKKSYIHSPVNQPQLQTSTGNEISEQQENNQLFNHQKFEYGEHIINAKRNAYNLPAKCMVKFLDNPNKGDLITDVQPYLSPELEYYPPEINQFAHRPILSPADCLARVHACIDRLNDAERNMVTLVKCEEGLGFFVEIPEIDTLVEHQGFMGWFTLFANISGQCHKGLLKRLPESKYKHIWMKYLNGERDSLNENDQATLQAFLKHQPNPLYFLSHFIWGEQARTQRQTVSTGHGSYFESLVPMYLDLIRFCIDYAGSKNEEFNPTDVQEDIFCEVEPGIRVPFISLDEDMNHA